MLGHSALGQHAIGQLPLAPDGVFVRGEFLVVGQSALFSRSMVAGTGAFTVGGETSARQIVMPAETGAFTAAFAAEPSRGYVLIAEPEVARSAPQPLFSPLGFLALGQSGVLSEQATTFLFTGANATLRRIAYLSAETGAFTFAGQDADVSVQGYPPNIRIFPRVGRGLRAFGTGRTIETTGTLVWNGEALSWNGEHLNWRGTIYRGGVVVRVVGGRKRETSAESLVWNGGPLVWNGKESKWQGTSRPKGIRARAFGG